MAAKSETVFLKNRWSELYLHNWLYLQFLGRRENEEKTIFDKNWKDIDREREREREKEREKPKERMQSGNYISFWKQPPGGAQNIHWIKYQLDICVVVCVKVVLIMKTLTWEIY